MKLLITASSIGFLSFVAMAQTPQVQPLPAAQQQQAIQNPAYVQPAATNVRPTLGERYLPRFMKNSGIAEDGLPIRTESFQFTAEEMKHLDDVDVVREALKREQRRLTKIFFQNHAVIKKYSASSRNKVTKTASDAIDKGLDEMTTMGELTTFTFEGYRGHMLRYASWIVGSRHARTYNPSGEASIWGWFIPQIPLDYISIISLILNIFLAVYVLKK